MPATAKTRTSRRMPLAAMLPRSSARTLSCTSAQVSARLDARREIHLGADDRVIHPVFRAEIADVAITGIDADPHLEGLLETAGAPFLLQFDHLPLHGHSHPHAGPRIGAPAFAGATKG